MIQYCKKKKKEGQQCHLCDRRHPNEKITVSLWKQLQHTPIRRDLKKKGLYLPQPAIPVSPGEECEFSFTDYLCFSSGGEERQQGQVFES